MTKFSTATSYSIVNPPGSTVTIKLTSTTLVDVFNTKVITTVVTMTDPTVTITSIVNTGTGPITNNVFIGGTGTGAVVGGSSAGGAVTVTVGAQSTSSL